MAAIPSTTPISTSPNTTGETPGGGGGFEAIFARIEEAGRQRAERDARKTEINEDIGAQKNAARTAST